MSASVTFRETIPRPATVLKLYEALAAILGQCQQLGIDPATVEVETTEVLPRQDQRPGESHPGSVILIATTKL